MEKRMKILFFQLMKSEKFLCVFSAQASRKDVHVRCAENFAHGADTDCEISQIACCTSNMVPMITTDCSGIFDE